MHGLNSAQLLVHVHATEQRLVEAGLEFVSHQQNLVLVAAECFADIAATQVRVQRLAGFSEGVGARLGVINFAGERHQGANWIALALHILVDCQLPAHRLLPTGNHHHGLSFAFQQRLHVFAEVLDHHLHFLRDVVRVQLDPAHDAFQRLAALHLGFAQLLTVVRQLEGGLVRRVVLQHIEDKTLLDRLAHGVHMKGCRQVVAGGW
ncbi:hypothetical protein FQZ97_691210 [compost metagenome]